MNTGLSLMNFVQEKEREREKERETTVKGINKPCPRCHYPFYHLLFLFSHSF